MSAPNLVIVESPAKAKTINKYLGKDYKVIASFGHVRDLPPKDGSVKPDEDFAMAWEMGDRSKKHVSEIVKLAKDSETVFLATDPDREGEAISWHICEILRDKKLIDKLDIQRVTFSEITKSAVQEAFANARQLDTDLIDAYLARRALDYLVGFTLSPVLWRKLPGSRSAGRVQSVALRLICERESEIEAFNAEEYWSIETLLKTKDNKGFTARLNALNGEKLGKMDLQNEAMAMSAVSKIEGQDLTVQNIERKQVARNPYPPFITSTLQQEASRKLGFGATRTMRTAQKLYEGIELGGETVGLITYMRTDGVTLSQDAINSARKLIENKFGANYLPNSPRMYKSKAKNAQEAHEAIRPTDMFRTPGELRAYLGDDEFRLYELIWKRTVACQMESAKLDQVGVDISNAANDFNLRATGSVIAFDGFFKVYQAERDEDKHSSDDDEKILPPLKEGDALKIDEINPNQHFTQPPPRYTEASLVKKMEELGIGRPSTYASIIQVLQDRDYVHLNQKRFEPEARGRIVIAFLQNFFTKYVEYNFTAELEDQLDQVSDGSLDWKTVLRDFWTAFSAKIDETKELTITEVIDALNEDLKEHLFPSDPEHPEKDGRLCPKCNKGQLSIKLGRFGAFVGCSDYPECKFTRQLVANDGEGEGDIGADGVKELGKCPTTGRMVTLRKGPYGPYVQLDTTDEEVKEAEKDAAEKQAEQDAKEKEDAEKAKAAGKKPKKPKKPVKVKLPKPKRMSIPKGMDVGEVDLEKALGMLSLPREIGTHPDTKEKIEASIGRFGPYLKHQGKFKSIPAGDDVLTIGMNRAVELLAQASQRGGAVLKELGEHPEDKKAVTVNSGRYGPYVKHGKLMASLPKNAEPDTVTMEQAVEWLNAKAEKDAAKKGKTTKKKTAKKK